MTTPNEQPHDGCATVRYEVVDTDGVVVNATDDPVALMHGQESTFTFRDPQGALWRVNDSKLVPVTSAQAGEKATPHPEDICQRCAGANVVWFTDNELWNRVIGESGILCPSCFVQMAEAKGINTAWKLTPESPTTPPRRDGKPTPLTDAQMFTLDCGADGNGTPHDVVEASFARSLERQLSNHAQLLAIQALKSREAHAAYVNELRSILKLPEGMGLCNALRDMVKTIAEKDAEIARLKNENAQLKTVAFQAQEAAKELLGKLTAAEGEAVRLKAHICLQSDALKSPTDVYEVVRRDELSTLKGAWNHMIYCRSLLNVPEFEVLGDYILQIQAALTASQQAAAEDKQLLDDLDAFMRNHTLTVWWSKPQQKWWAQGYCVGTFREAVKKDLSIRAARASQAGKGEA